MQKDKQILLARKWANRMVARGIESGELKRPRNCEKCFQEHWIIIAHHEDYNKPLDVQWLCQPCHIRRHIKKPVSPIIENLNYVDGLIRG